MIVGAKIYSRLGMSGFLIRDKMDCPTCSPMAAMSKPADVGRVIIKSILLIPS